MRRVPERRLALDLAEEGVVEAEIEDMRAGPHLRLEHLRSVLREEPAHDAAGIMQVAEEAGAADAALDAGGQQAGLHVVGAEGAPSPASSSWSRCCRPPSVPACTFRAREPTPSHRDISPRPPPPCKR